MIEWPLRPSPKTWWLGGLNKKSLKVLLGYNYFPHQVNIKQRVEGWLARLRTSGFNVEGFVLTIDPPRSAMGWKELNQRWQRGDKALIYKYEQLINRISDGGFDVFVNANGSGIHPEFVPYIPATTVYACFDDPESSEKLSKPVASAFDLSMVGNIACLDMYRTWGVKYAYWWPIGHHPNDYDHTLTEESIRSMHRDHNLTILCERVSSWRINRLDKVVKAFPNGQYYGKGWPKGFLPESERIPLLRNTKIGINIHNSIGPVNSRTYVLPANGVMQICDNKSNLAKIYNLGSEVIGYESMEEAIELCHYYLRHEDERQEIAVNGWKRAIREYNELAVFQRLIDAVHDVRQTNPQISSLSQRESLGKLHLCRRKTIPVRLLKHVSTLWHRFFHFIKSRVNSYVRS